MAKEGEKSQFSRTMTAMEFESGCMVDKDGSGPNSIDEAVSQRGGSPTLTVSPLQRVEDPETGHVIYVKPLDYDNGSESTE